MLRTRLFLNLVPFIVILVAISAYAIALFSRLAASVDAGVTENYQSVLAAQTMNLAMARMQTAVLLAFENKKDLAQAVFLENKALFEANLAIQSTKVSAPDEMELNSRLKSNYQSFQTAGTTILSLLETQEQRSVYAKDFYPALLAINGLLDKLRALNHQAILATSERVSHIAGRVSHLMVIGMVVALVLSSYVCYQVSRSILDPIRSLTKATQELGKGNLAQLVPVDSKDELGDLAVSFNRMAAQLQAYRQSTTERIVQLHGTMEAMLASFPDPIFVINKEGGIELANRAADELMEGLHLKSRLPGRLQDKVSKVLNHCENFLPHSFDEVLSFRLEDEEKFFLPRIVAMRNKEEALIGVAVVLYDVTRFRLLDDAKTNLIATVSHELKTPLTSVRMVLHLLLEKTFGGLTHKQNDLLQTAREDAERLLRILNDLLDLARLEEGHTELHKERATASDLVRSSLDEMSEAASVSNLKIKTEIEPELPAVWVDRLRIKHVFTNLIANAIKHSPVSGEILLRAGQTENGDVHFGVHDQGAGVPDEYKTRIFDRFFRVPGQKKTGAGLGLSIAREIVVAHGGRIGVRNGQERGSEFYFVLKAATDS